MTLMNGEHFIFANDPLDSLLLELSLAEKSGGKDRNAMSLATVDAEGAPSLRTVLFKGLVEGGLSFYTNYGSQKAQELDGDPAASALFFWADLERQVRLKGRVQKLDSQHGDAYFRSRHRLSQIGAWASQQSQEISDHKALEERVQELEIKFAGKDVPRPPHWGGYKLIPLYMEFWFGQKGRLHYRYCFDRPTENDPWRRFQRQP